MNSEERLSLRREKSIPVLETIRNRTMKSEDARFLKRLGQGLQLLLNQCISSSLSANTNH